MPTLPPRTRSAGGVHPRYHKDLCREKAIVDVPTPTLLRVSMAQHLGVSVDELLGLKPVRNRSTSAMERRWLRKFEGIRRLSGRKQRSIMQVLDMALEKG